MSTPQSSESVHWKHTLNRLLRAVSRDEVGSFKDVEDWHHQELQKARADWLRSEIEKVEGIGYEREDSLISPLESHRHNDIEYGFELARTSIITRYKEELKVLTGE